MNLFVFVLIIDGLFGVGKGIISCIIVCRMGWYYLDLGVLYWVVGVVVSWVDIDIFDVLVLVCCIFDIYVQFVEQGDVMWVMVNGIDVIDELCLEIIGVLVLVIVVILEVWVVLKECQCVFRELLGLVVDGCDMGMVIFLDVFYKVFLIVSVEECVECWYKQLKDKGVFVNFDDFLCEIMVCDVCDVQCIVVFLKLVDDVVFIDIIGIGIDDVVV